MVRQQNTCDGAKGINMKLSFLRILVAQAFISSGAVLGKQLIRKQEAARESSHDKASFQDPGPRMRPKFRYWIPDASVEADVLSQDVKRAKDAGMGGLELLGYYLYGGPPENGAGRGTYAPVDWAEYGFGGQKWCKSVLSKDITLAPTDTECKTTLFVLSPTQ